MYGWWRALIIHTSGFPGKTSLRKLQPDQSEEILSHKKVGRDAVF
jgi:hypothetical protein